MITCLGKVLSPEEVELTRGALAGAEFADGRLTAGIFGQATKNNLQLKPGDGPSRPLAQLVSDSLARHQTFCQAALPRAIAPPTFNRYDVGMSYGRHVDSPLLGGARFRADLSVAVFLSEPDSYDGGELCMESDVDARRVKLPAGDAVLYPAGMVHWVEPVTRGVRLAALTWVQSVIRDHAMRQVVNEVAKVVGQLHESEPGSEATQTLLRAYANLVRLVADP
jgi:PKHD-type hydroxylase